MFTRAAVFKLELKDVSIAKYLKPEAQAEAQALEEKLLNLEHITEEKEKEFIKAKHSKPEAQAEEEKLQNFEDFDIYLEEKRKFLKPYEEEEQKTRMKLVDIIVQNVVIRETTINFLLKSLLKEEVYTIVDTSIKKINQLTEIIDELYIIENQIEDYPDDLSKEEGDKLYLLVNYIAGNKCIFEEAREKIEKQLDEFIGNLLEIIICIKDTRTNMLDEMEKGEVIKDIIKKISKNILCKKMNIVLTPNNK